MIADLDKLIYQFSSTTVLIVGDVMIDRYLRGSVERISPEAPVPVVSLQQTEERLGGAANVALNIKALGAQPLLCSVLGRDANAQRFLDLMPQVSLSTNGIMQSGERRTTVKSRIVASNQHLLRIDEEDRHELSAEEEEQFMDLLLRLLNEHPVDIILFQDYNKGVLTTRIINTLLLEAIRRDIPTAVDPKQYNFMSYKRATLFKPNLGEVNLALNHNIIVQAEQLRAAAQQIRARLYNKYLLITLSDKGIYIDESTGGAILPTQARQVADVCGAGDTVISIAALCLAAGLSLQDIGILANLGGGQVCERFGVVPVNLEQLLNEYHQLMSDHQGHSSHQETSFPAE
ncbi:MAG: bifunctional ADP-heptose synthase [Bacteroidota bacterium]